MDDSTLKKLVLLTKASKEALDLTPAFARSIKEYSTILQSDQGDASHVSDKVVNCRFLTIYQIHYRCIAYSSNL